MGIRSQGDPSQSYDDVFADTGKGGSGAASGGGGAVSYTHLRAHEPDS